MRSISSSVPVLLTRPMRRSCFLSQKHTCTPRGSVSSCDCCLLWAKKENIQFFIETHSEHVLHVILNAVAKGEWTRDQVALHYFQNKNGVANVAGATSTSSAKSTVAFRIFLNKVLQS